jgi:DNA-binding NarL/FixJ family response regulator
MDLKLPGMSGVATKDIASLLGIAEAAILMRLKVNDRTQAVVTALRRGLIHL